MSRTRNFVKNALYGVAGKVISMLLGFASRTVFIFYLGETYLGISGLYTEILSMLSFTELGLGSAMIYAMYAPVAQEDRKKTTQLLDFYKRAYRIIAVAIAVIGVGLLPFLQHIVKGADMVTLSELRLYYLLFLLNTVISYFVTYKFSYPNALQKGYIITRFDMLINTVTVVAQIAAIVLFRNFLAYLLVQIGCSILGKVLVSFYLNRKFPILTETPEESLPKAERQDIFREVKALAVHQVASVAVHSTDNIIISALSGLGVMAVGLVSNYMLIINSVLGFVLILFNSTASGFGNLATENSTERFREVFLDMNFLNFWTYGFCSIAFFVLIPPFITLWIGERFLIDTLSLFLIVTNCFWQGQMTMYHQARIAKGKFYRDQWLAFIQAVVNLVVSVIGAKLMGLPGVYVGTVVSRLVMMVSRPYSTYRYLFGRSSAEYYLRLLRYSCAVLLAGGITWLLSRGLLIDPTPLKFIGIMGIVTVIPNVLFFVLFGRTKEFLSLQKRVRGLLGKERV